MKISDVEFNKLVSFMRSNYGINLSQKRNLIEGRLGNVIVSKGYSKFEDYLDFVFSSNGKEEAVAMIDRLTTNHTYFMRESSHFDYFRNVVLPYLEHNKRDKDLRIWSAGCSSGEEPYTLAMIIDEYFQNKSGMWDKSLLATDISTSVLEKAEKAIYSKESISKMPVEYQNKYFTKISEDSYQVVPFIKQRVILNKFNLMTPQFPFKKKFDVIFCRNVMIYFEKDTKDALVRRFYDNIQDGGYLFIGQAESITKNDAGFVYMMPSVYRKI